MEDSLEASPGRDLGPGCARCAGLCCVAPAFSASADFAIDKDAGQACPNLRSDFSCEIHPRLRREGFPGCAAYDCFGAGQRVIQSTFGGRDWQRTPEIAAGQFQVFAITRQFHELLWYLTEALTMQRALSIYPDLKVAFDETERIASMSPDSLLESDVPAHRDLVGVLLLRASELVRAEARDEGIDHRGADLVGADLGKADLRGANLRGARLIGANLVGADLRLADLLGADLRGADLSDADLAGSIFLTRSQLDAATGNHGTKLPTSLTRPTHWR